ARAGKEPGPRGMETPAVEALEERGVGRDLARPGPAREGAEPPFAVLEERSDARAREAVPRVVLAKAVASQPHDTGVIASDPEVPVAILGQRPDACPGKPLTGRVASNRSSIGSDFGQTAESA